MIYDDHNDVPDPSFLLLAVTVNGIVGRSAPFYSEQKRSYDKSKEPELPLVPSDDSDNEGSDEADSTDNDFSLLFGRPPPAHITSTTDKVRSTSVPVRSAIDPNYRNLQEARLQYTTSGKFQLCLCTSTNTRIRRVIYTLVPK